jgi:hypothetical protein
MTSAD